VQIFWHRFVIIFCLLSTILVESSKAETLIGPRTDFFKIDHILLEGTRKVEKEAILEKIGSKEGMVLDNYLLKKDIEKIYSMKYFESVEAHHLVKEGENYLVFKLTEKPIIKKITLQGSDDVSDDDVKEQIKSKEFNILDINLVKADVAAIGKFYEEKGYYLATIDYIIKKLDKDNIELIFNIKEFDKVRVKKVTFLGNRAFDDRQLMTLMETKEDSVLSFISGAGNFKEFNFQTDMERVKYHYRTNGYLQVNVAKPEITISEDRKWVFITVKIQEGPQFSINSISFDGELLFTESELQDKIGLKVGEIYSEEKLKADIQSLTEIYQDQGYAFANVLRTLEIVPGENKVDVKFSFEKGKIAYFGKISMVGNSKTRDKVVRRELKIREGMKFSGTALRQSRENVTRLGFFEQGSVLFNTSSPKGKDNVLDVEIAVKERNTGQISIGAGYSTAQKYFLQSSISQNNFLGKGQVLSLSLSWSQTNQVFNLGFTEPYLFDSKWTAGGDIFRSRDQTSHSYTNSKEGFDLRVGYPLAEYTHLFATYKYEDSITKEFPDPTIDRYVENGLASSLITEIRLDKRNNRHEPTDGYWGSFSMEFTGLGGKKQWVKSRVEGRYYKKVWSELVFRSRVRAERLYNYEKEIPRYVKFALGGSRDMRGYVPEAIGPKIYPCLKSNNGVCTDHSVAFNSRGLFSLLSTFELEYPIVKEAGLKFVTFFDVGNVWAKFPGERLANENRPLGGRGRNFNVKADYGFGFRWFAPIGVLRFEFGYPLSKVEGDQDSHQFHFDIGQLF